MKLYRSPDEWGDQNITMSMEEWEAAIPSAVWAARDTAFYGWYIDVLGQHLDLPEDERPKWADYREYLLNSLEPGKTNKRTQVNGENT